RFYRSSTARSLPGSGLGLAIVRQVAQAHGATAVVENAEGGGARFRVRFPAAEGAAAPPELTPSAYGLRRSGNRCSRRSVPGGIGGPTRRAAHRRLGAQRGRRGSGPLRGGDRRRPRGRRRARGDPRLAPAPPPPADDRAASRGRPPF